MSDELAHVDGKADTAPLKRAAERREGSSPSVGTKRICKRCDLPKELLQFKLKKNGSRSHTCTQCWTSSYWSRRGAYQNELARVRRQANPAQAVWTDSRRFDLRNNLENDLTKDFIREMLSKPCIYCGETQLRMTLDRIDNAKGHMRANVVAACLRCNYFRRDMPYEAWLHIVPSLREAREMGLLGSWTGRARSCVTR